jgi:hypothetical protein
LRTPTTVESTPERITALAFGQLKFQTPDIFHRYLIVAHGTTISFLDLDGGSPQQKDIDLTNRNIYDPLDTDARNRCETTPVKILSIAVVPYGDLVIEVRGGTKQIGAPTFCVDNARWILNVDAHDQSAKNERNVQHDTLGMFAQGFKPCGPGGSCPGAFTCVESAWCHKNGPSCPVGTTNVSVNIAAGGSCLNPMGGGTNVCCVDGAIPNTFGAVDGRLSIMPDGQLLHFQPLDGLNATNWKSFKVVP